MREQEVVLEHHADRSLLGRHVDAGARIVVHGAVELDAPLGQRAQPGERAQQRRLAGTVRPDDCHRLPGADGQVRVEREAVELDGDLGGQRHRVVSQRSRSAINTTNEMMSRTSESTIAESGFAPSSLM